MHRTWEDMRAATQRTAVAATTRRRTFAAPVEARLRERIGVFEDAVRRTAASEDGEAIHDLRVAARRLIAFMRMWRVLLPGGRVRRVVRAVRATRRNAGRVRDVEVQVEMLRERLGRDQAPDADALDLLREMEGRLVRRRRRAAKRARAPRSRSLLARLAATANAMSQDLLSHLEAFEGAHARERKLREAAIGALGTSLEASDDAALHRARIAVKKWRYALESLDASGARPSATAAALRPLQDVLGGILDGAALRAVVAERVGEGGREGPARTLPALLAQLDVERSPRLRRFHALAGEFLRSVEALPEARPRVTTTRRRATSSS